MCRNFTTRLWDKVENLNKFKKIVAQKINVILFFEYFFRVLHEASSSWLKYLYNFQEHPVQGYYKCHFFGKNAVMRFLFNFFKLTIELKNIVNIINFTFSFYAYLNYNHL
jgi:hypothetical protein